MDKQKYISALFNANYRSTLWMTIAGFTMLANVCLAVFIVNLDTSEKTIIVPPQLNQSFWIEGDRVSPTYLEQMSKYFSQLLLTYHKDNALSQFETILKHVDPAVYATMKTRFELDYEKIKRNSVSSAFYPMAIHVKKKSTYIRGELVLMIGQQIVSRKQKAYEMNFEYKGGNLFIQTFKEINITTKGEFGNEIESENKMMIEGNYTQPVNLQQRSQQGAQ